MAGKDEALHIVRSELDALKLRIIERHINAGQKASGRTIASLHVEMLQNGGILWGRQAFEVLETGRGSGSVPKNFTKVIQQWIIDKGIAVESIPYKRQASSKWQPKYTPEERGMMRLSGAIAHKIASEGTALHRRGTTEDIYSSEVEKTIENIMNKVFGIFERDVEHINLHNDENRGI